MGKLINEGPKWLFMVTGLSQQASQNFLSKGSTCPCAGFLCVAANIGLFVGYFIHYYEKKEFYYYRVITGYTLALARASAAPLNLDCMLILLPVCRNLISFLRGSLTRCCKRNVVRLLDKNITFHKTVAYLICFWTAVHYFAHAYNFEYFMLAHNSPNNDTRALLQALSNLPQSIFPNTTWINPVRAPDPNLILECVKCVAGSTGVVITLALIIMVSSSTETIRRSYFEVFWYTHHLFVLFFIGLVVHGVQGLVRIQSNLDLHDPYTCKDEHMHWGKSGYCPEPSFAPGKAKTWYWVLGPMILYFLERCIRLYRSQQRVVIKKVVEHPSRVIELQMMKKGFKMQAGEYIFLHCPSISKLEWHPFTLTSSPHDDHFSVHIRTVGDWTEALAKAVRPQEGNEFQMSWQLPQVAVDGPFGTASEDIYRYQVDVLVAAGIGVTPFGAVLKDIWYRFQKPDNAMKLKKVYIYWISPDTQAFEWFADLLKVLEQQMMDAGCPDFLNYNIYLTKWNEQLMQDVINREAIEESDYCTITGLRQRTNYGRPNWDSIFGDLAQRHPGTSIGVFFCGPKGLSKTLHDMSNKHSDRNIADPSATQFFYNKENF